MSYYDITVLPFEYSDVPLYHINDGESVDCYTGKNNNSSYIVQNKDFGIVYYSVKFHGIEPKEFALYIQCIDYLKESEKSGVERYVNHTSSYTSNKIGKIISKSKICLILIETDIDTKFSFQINAGYNELYLLKN